MATQRNSFQLPFPRGKRRTPAEIAAASQEPRFLGSVQTQQTRPTSTHTRTSSWVLDQGVLLPDEDLILLKTSSRPQTSRHAPALARDRGSEAIRQRPRSQTGRAGVFPHTPPSSCRISSHGAKRKASCLDDSDDEVIIVHPPPSGISRRGSCVTTIIDLTEQHHPKRRSSFLGNYDDDVMIIDPPAAEMRHGLRPLLHGKLWNAANLAGKGASQEQMRLEPARGQRRRKFIAATRENSEQSPRNDPVSDTIVVNPAGAMSAEVTAILQNVVPATNLFSLPAELRDEIYRHLLVGAKPIHVQNLWTETSRRPSRRGRGGDSVDTTIDTRILSVCRQTAVEGTRILYSENTFLYLLRDEVSSTGRRSQRIAGRAQELNLVKYGHLIRHMAIELEPNRTEPSYETLMADALKALTPRTNALSPIPDYSIHLHTLTVTVSPLLQAAHRTVRAPAQGGDQDLIIHEGRFLSAVNFFSKGAAVLKALQRINADFLRINVHVNSDIRNDPDSEGDNDEADSDSDDATSEPDLPRPKRRHLETTIDLRYLPRHMDALRRREGQPWAQLWAHDTLMQARRREQGQQATEALAHLRRHIEDACLQPERALRRGGVWEEHHVAERRRQEQQAKVAARFDADVAGAGRSGEDGERRIVRGVKSLIISIARVEGGLRAYRP